MSKRMFRVGGGAVVVLVMVAVLVGCLGTPTPVSPVPTPISPLPTEGSPVATATPRPSPVSGDRDIGDLAAAGRGFVTTSARQDVVIAWDDLAMSEGWVQLGVESVDVVGDEIVAVVRSSTGETWTFTDTVENESVEIPSMDYRLDCSYKLIQFDEVLQTGTIINAVQPLTDTELYDPAAIPGAGVYATIEYELATNFIGVAELWERCCWVASDPWPDVCVLVPGGTQDADGYWLVNLVDGAAGAERVWLPKVGRTKVK